jgi:predicted small secreted protein
MSREVLLLIALSILLACFLMTGCQTSGLAGTCKRFNMDTDTVTVYAIDSETKGASKTITKFQCVQRKYKD